MVRIDAPKADSVAVKAHVRVIAECLDAIHITVEVEFADEDGTMREARPVGSMHKARKHYD